MDLDFLDCGWLDDEDASWVPGAKEFCLNCEPYAAGFSPVLGSGFLCLFKALSGLEEGPAFPLAVRASKRPAVAMAGTARRVARSSCHLVMLTIFSMFESRCGRGDQAVTGEFDDTVRGEAFKLGYRWDSEDLRERMQIVVREVEEFVLLDS